MALPPGTRLGVYEVTVQIGVGGMGEVHRARDTQLNREVALKVLPERFAGDPERLARFTREAHTLASLNHPNIAAIYGIEASQDVRALVMEFLTTCPGSLEVMRHHEFRKRVLVIRALSQIGCRARRSCPPLLSYGA